MSLVHRPSREDYFPHTKRGHGTTHRYARVVNKVQTRNATYCVDASCVLNSPRSTNLHQDIAANMKDWCDAHGLTIRGKDRPYARFGSASEAIRVSTGGR